MSGETGLMGLAVDPEFARTGALLHLPRLAKPGGGARHPGHRLDASTPRAPRAALVKILRHRLPHHARPARRLPAAGRRSNGSMLVGTGDAAHRHQPAQPDLARRQDTAPRPDHRRAVAEQHVHPRASNRRKRYVHTYGHRNVQGLAQRADGSLWSVEHGPGPRRRGQPARPTAATTAGTPCPATTSRVPMTDQSPARRAGRARWTLRLPDAGDLRRRLRPRLAVGRLQRHPRGRLPQGSRVLFLKFDAAGQLQVDRAPAALRAVRPAALGDRSPPTATCWSPPPTAAARTRSCGSPRSSRAGPSGGPVEQRAAGVDRAEPDRDARAAGATAAASGTASTSGRSRRTAGPARRRAGRPTAQQGATQPAGRVQEEGAGHAGHADERPGRDSVGTA